MDDLAGITSWLLLGSAAVVSLVHGLLPNHWLPFVLIGRVQGWTGRRMLHVLAAAGAAHVAVAGAIALVTLLAGIALADMLAGHADILPGLILLAAGLAYVALDLRANSGHRHHHHDVHEAASAGMSDRAAVATLVLTLALSPCEAMVPVFISAAPTGNHVLLLMLIVVSGVASVGVMGTLAWVTWRGSRQVEFGRLARRERLVIGVVLAVIGAITLAIVTAGGHA